MIENIDCSKEIWKTIAGYEGLYEVSNWGRVKAFNYERTIMNGLTIKRVHYDEYILPSGANAKDHKYVRVTLRKNGISTSYAIHRLVAMAFIPNPNNYPIINHKDENPSNNRVDNLEWCTTKYNINYGTAIARAKQASKISRLLRNRKALCTEFGEPLATPDEQKAYADYLNATSKMNIKPEEVAFIPSDIRDKVLTFSLPK